MHSENFMHSILVNVLQRSRWSTTMAMAKLEWLEANRIWIDFTISIINVNLNVNICSLNVIGYICNVNIWMQREDAFYSGLADQQQLSTFLR